MVCRLGYKCPFIVPYIDAPEVHIRRFWDNFKYHYHRSWLIRGGEKDDQAAGHLVDKRPRICGNNSVEVFADLGASCDGVRIVLLGYGSEDGGRMRGRKYSVKVGEGVLGGGSAVFSTLSHCGNILALILASMTRPDGLISHSRQLAQSSALPQIDLAPFGDNDAVAMPAVAMRITENRKRRRSITLKVYSSSFGVRTSKYELMQEGEI